jgi:hypothetical protein
MSSIPSENSPNIDLIPAAAAGNDDSNPGHVADHSTAENDDSSEKLHDDAAVDDHLENSLMR